MKVPETKHLPTNTSAKGTGENQNLNEHQHIKLTCQNTDFKKI